MPLKTAPSPAELGAAGDSSGWSNGSGVDSRETARLKEASRCGMAGCPACGLPYNH